MEKKERFSKESGPLFSIKKDFFSNNASLLEETHSINSVYAEQEARGACKNCQHDIGEADFESFGVAYSICGCGHLNGMHEDSEGFTNFLYKDNGGDNYKESYLKDYDSRVENIYKPKVQFLLDVVGECSVRDVGCGGGHFVKACELMGVDAIGIDPSESLINMGKSKLVYNQIDQCETEDFIEFIESADSVVSMIGVLEHLREPNRAIEAFNKSGAEYLYISVPLLSPSVFIEHANPGVFPRHLGRAHTHLYTKESLEYMARVNNLEVVGEWWFGSDMMDLYRTLLASEGSEKYRLKVKEMLGDYIDQLQSVLDRNRVCSEVHLILKKKREKIVRELDRFN
jgi:2-polyprenyl-3-methyl-5-hydroxy-6-metoxy-1,4-benzoquinol methylase